ncbi:MAG: tetratricopeptide repeat protein [Bacteroidetes bacterium]|nr:MAG: tetratricopeptide repeat protein [Bacteroidota bacterium]TAG88081.1 MAG: tetratricopeptide repeat protein [Bacteroidota bacterium]
MKSIFLFIFLWINPLNFIVEINELSRLIEFDYQKGDFVAVEKNLKILLEEYEINTPEIYLNLAHSYFNRRIAEKAKFYYEKSLLASNPEIQSIAYNQLGFLAYSQQNSEEAINYFRESLRKNSQNFEARYNFELVQKQLIKQGINPNQEKQKKNQKSDSQSQTNQTQLNQEKAEALLNTIKKQESQYLQQRPKGITLPPPPPGKPDW